MEEELQIITTRLPKKIIEYIENMEYLYQTPFNYRKIL